MGFYLSALAQLSQKDKKRIFKGIAHSGKPFKLNGKTTIIDLATLSFKAQIPALIEHDPLRRAGSARVALGDEGLEIEGVLLSNSHGQEIAQDADEGFPWQLSVHVMPKQIKSISKSQQIEINGKKFQGPMDVFYGADVREVSFTPVGVDGNTYAAVLSDFKNEEQNMDQEMSLEEALAKIAELEKKLNDLEVEKATLEEARNIQALDAELSLIGLDKNKDLSKSMYSVLLSAQKAERAEMLNDLKKQKAPEFLQKEQLPSEAKLSTSALLNDAEKRHKSKMNYI